MDCPYHSKLQVAQSDGGWDYRMDAMWVGGVLEVDCRRTPRLASPVATPSPKRYCNWWLCYP